MWSDEHHSQPRWFEPVEKPFLSYTQDSKPSQSQSGQCSHSRDFLNSWYQTGFRMCVHAGTQWNDLMKAVLSGGWVRAGVLLCSLVRALPCHMVAKQVKDLVCGDILRGTSCDLGRVGWWHILEREDSCIILLWAVLGCVNSSLYQFSL